MNTTLLQDRRVWLGGGSIVAVLLVAASWFLFISPKMSSADQLRDTAAATRASNDTLAHKNAMLAKQYQGIAVLRADLRHAVDALPADSGLPAFTFEAQQAADSSKITLKSVTVGAITPVAAATPAPDPTSGSGSTATSPTTPVTGSDTGAGSGTGTGAGTTSAAGTQFAIKVTLQCSGGLNRLTTFLKSIENGRRSASVTSVQVTTTAGDHAANDVRHGGDMTAQLVVYSAPMGKAEYAALKKMLAQS